MNPIEILATLLGLANILLLVRRSIWNYPFGLLMVAVYAYIFFGAKLYSDALLQIFFFVIQLYTLFFTQIAQSLGWLPSLLVAGGSALGLAMALESRRRAAKTT